MAAAVQLRRGTTAQTNAFTGALGEVTVDTDKKTLVVHDGSTAGGRALPQFDSSGNLTISTGNVLLTGGNVGIGTTAPAYALDVVGLARGAFVQVSGSYTNGNTTPNIRGISFLSISNTGSTTISNFTGGVAGQIIYLLFNDSNTTINRTNAYLSGGVNFTSTSADMLTLYFNGTYWYEVSRSINA